MAVRFSEPTIITRGPYRVVGAWCAYEGDDEGPGWNGAYAAFSQRRGEIAHVVGALVLGFLYRPHNDDPAVSDDVRAAFVGVEVAALPDGRLPVGLASTHFSGGQYVLVDCSGDTPGEAAEGVGQAIADLTAWMPTHGYREGDACFAASHEGAPTPPWVETVYIKLEPA